MMGTLEREERGKSAWNVNTLAGDGRPVPRAKPLLWTQLDAVDLPGAPSRCRGSG